SSRRSAAGGFCGPGLRALLPATDGRPEPGRQHAPRGGLLPGSSAVASRASDAQDSGHRVACPTRLATHFFRRVALAPSLPSAVRVFFGSLAMVRFFLAALPAFLMF